MSDGGSISRRSFVGAVGVSLTAACWPGAARAQAARVWHGKTARDLMRLRDQALPDGYRYRSLSLYGTPATPLYAAVMIKLDAPQHDRLALTEPELVPAVAAEARQGFGPAIIAAMAPPGRALFAMVFEPQNSQRISKPVKLAEWQISRIGKGGALHRHGRSVRYRRGDPAGDREIRHRARQARQDRGTSDCCPLI